MISEDALQLQNYFYQTNDYLDDKISDRLLVLGIGNFIMGDEGVGVHTIHELSKISLPPDVDIMDGGTGSFNLMPILAKYKRVIIIDASNDDKEEGEVGIIYPKFSKDFPKSLSVHDVGLKDMLEALEFNDELPIITLITVTIKKIEPMSTTLSPGIKDSINVVIKKIFELVSTI